MRHIFKEILKGIEETKNAPKTESEYNNGWVTACDVIKAMIEQLSAEKNDGWIPCSEQLPEDGVDVLVWFEYFRYGHYNRLFSTIGISYTYNGECSGFVNGSSGWRDLTIFAWQPLPAPYQPHQREEKE